MALVDPNIAMSFRAPEIKPRNALAEFAQMQQIVGGQRQAEVAELQLDALRQEREALRGIQEAIVAKGGPPDLGAAADAMIRTGRPEYLAKGMQIRQMVANQNAWSEYQKQFLSPEPPSAEGAPANVLAPTAAATSPVNALAAPDIRSLENRYRMVAGLDTPGAQAEAKLLLEQIKSAQTGAVPPAEVKTMQMLGIPITPEGYAQYRAAQSPVRPTSDQQNYELAKSQGFKGSFFDFKRQLAEAGRAPAQPREPSAPVAVVNEATGGITYVTREEALGRTPASAIQSLPPKEIQKREATYPQATQAVKGFEAKSQAFIKDLIALRDHPGLAQITGLVAGRVPGVTAEGRAAQALYDKVVAKGGFQALQDMRDASKTGGALGNVSNAEGKQLIASAAAIDRRQDAKDVQAAINQFISDIEGSQVRMREAYDDTYSYRSQRSGAASQPAGGATGGWSVVR